MNSVLLLSSDGDPPEERAMDELNRLSDHVARLESDVEHIKSDVADIKLDLRRMDDRLTAMDARLSGRIDAVDNRLGDFEKCMAEKFGDMKLWVLGLYVAQAASLLLVIAKGFKWF